MKKLLLIVLFACMASGLKAQKMPSVPDTNVIYVAVQVQPSYPGGLTAFQHFIAQNIKRVGKTGSAYITFVVERDGNLSGVKAMRAANDDMAAEAIRVVIAAGKWVPGMQNDTKVRVQYTVPVNFTN